MSHDRPLVVLLVEDDDTIRELSTMILEGEGHEVHTAPNADVADKWLEGNTPDLLFTDLRMPGKLSGMDLADRHTDIRVLITSGEAAPDAGSLRDGVKYLAKPYDRKTLLEAVRRAAA